MGKSSIERWQVRACVYQDILIQEGPAAAQQYLDKFKTTEMLNHIWRYQKAAKESPDAATREKALIAPSPDSGLDAGMPGAAVQQ